MSQHSWDDEDEPRTRVDAMLHLVIYTPINIIVCVLDIVFGPERMARWTRGGSDN